VTGLELEGIGREAANMEACLLGSGAAPLFGRELRDLRDIRHLAEVCRDILTAK